MDAFVWLGAGFYLQQQKDKTLGKEVRAAQRGERALGSLLLPQSVRALGIRGYGTVRADSWACLACVMLTVCLFGATGICNKMVKAHKSKFREEFPLGELALPAVACFAAR